ncbi:MAG TPA: metallophosphoesterase [Ilumatobacter sp.]
MIELTTVADDLAVFHDGVVTHRHEGLAPGSRFELHGIAGRTLDRPGGELLVRFATVNDVHFGETECGVIDQRPDGPILRSAPGEPPYPEVMNRAAVDEIAALDPAAVLVKGDLSADGHDEEWAAFEACWRPSFGDRLHVVRGNHDAYRGQHRYAGDRWIELPGITVGLLDTTIPLRTTGALRRAQLAEIDERLGATDARVLLMGHHQQWVPTGPGSQRSADYFGLHPDSSDALDELCVRHRGVIGYTAGHTHRHRVRSMVRSGVPSIEIGCVKDFPGTWAEYRVYEGGVMQVVHRISAPDALSWSDRCRVIYSDFGIDYQTYALGTLAERCFVFPER